MTNRLRLPAGEVNAPGPQPLTGQISALQALAAAGGFKDFAKTSASSARLPPV